MTPAPKSVWRNPVHFLAFGLGSGTVPFAPGTFGTLAAIPFYWLMSSLTLPYYLGILVVTMLVGIYLCGKTSRDLGVHDHSGIVWDEFVGYWLTMAAVPFSWQSALWGFVVFRVFDIIKPWPIRTVDRRVAGGFGIMFDDVLAGVYAWSTMHLWFWLQ
ncbi:MULTISPECIES: phosphatidylglycerophosphatase A family protein [Larsenimonas]|uniref:Phosphatidylglycerophosphatase A n=1 Tax=Larsenimonas suaedae TaxID=1851019 RepID=A0ABU1GWL1_9GAMM|nr:MULTISPECIES: phosphatidylglycerophosphatase A [Larsenimonas]MCM2972957.1 phosphatidylglycerophosphatase A [Larsenimonas suaedae]MCM5704901.1 phosphatidylglycerophosphatase A [Larsenimonas salina]MDR5896394.1 phosphatidylglycerophosphatase A [Larsenimonas suaedae]